MLVALESPFVTLTNNRSPRLARISGPGKWPLITSIFRTTPVAVSSDFECIPEAYYHLAQRRSHSGSSCRFELQAVQRYPNLSYQDCNVRSLTSKKKCFVKRMNRGHLGKKSWPLRRTAV